MLIQLNTDKNIELDAALAEQAETLLHNALGHFGERITRVEVHLSDRNSSQKSGADDMRCLLDARLAGLKPIVVSHNAATVKQAIDGATEKLKRSLERALGRLGAH